MTFSGLCEISEQNSSITIYCNSSADRELFKKKVSDKTRGVKASEDPRYYCITFDCGNSRQNYNIIFDIVIAEGVARGMCDPRHLDKENDFMLLIQWQKSKDAKV